jgi:hypothetical protein
MYNASSKHSMAARRPFNGGANIKRNTHDKISRYGSAVIFRLEIRPRVSYIIRRIFSNSRKSVKHVTPKSDSVSTTPQAPRAPWTLCACLMMLDAAAAEMMLSEDGSASMDSVTGGGGAVAAAADKYKYKYKYKIYL